jgi:hypothetical protein
VGRGPIRLSWIGAGRWLAAPHHEEHEITKNTKKTFFLSVARRSDRLTSKGVDSSAGSLAWRATPRRTRNHEEDFFSLRDTPQRPANQQGRRFERRRR